MRMIGEHGVKDSSDSPTALIERAELDAAVPGGDFERRTDRAEVPTRVPPGIFISRGEVDASTAVEFAH
jgi:hypothetical protein